MTSVNDARGRATRQTIILAAIGALHVGAFILVSTGISGDFGQLLANPPVAVFIPPPVPIPTADPGPVLDPGYSVAEAPRPPLEIPRFYERIDPTPGLDVNSEGAVGAGPAVPPADYRAPALRTRDSRLAALIDGCYPATSRRLGEEGRVVTRLSIDASGRPMAWSVEGTSGFVRLDAAVDCVIRRLEFIPGRRDGRGVEATVLLPIVFELH